MKKIIGSILAFAGIFLLFALPVLAAEGEENTYTAPAPAGSGSETDPLSQTEAVRAEPAEPNAEDETVDASADNGTEDEAPANASTGSETEKEVAEASDGNGAENAEPGETVFSSLYRLLCDHAGEIFSTLAFLASMLVAFAYKRGLLPLLNSGISALTGAATRIGEAADGSLKSADGLYAKMAERLSGAEEQLRAGTAALESFSERLRALEKSPDSTAALGQVLAEQVQMLAEIFQSTSLPQFRKDEIAQRALAMKEVAAAFAREAARETEASA